MNSQTKDELSVSPSTVGYKLIWLIRQKCKRESITQYDLAEIIGVSASHISNIFTARKDMRTFDRDTFKKIAAWLELPVLSVMMLAELVTPEDFYLEDAKSASIQRAINLILNDPEWGAFAPKEILTADLSIQLYIIWCYEQATKTKLISGAVDYLDLMENLSEFREEHKPA